MRMLEGALLVTAVTVLVLAAIQDFVALLWSAGNLGWMPAYPPVAYAMSGFAAVTVMVLLARRHLGRFWEPLVALCAMGGIVWIASQAGVRMLSIPTEQLVLSATLAMAGCGILSCLFRNRTSLWMSQAMLSFLLAASSCVLLSTQWFQPVLQGMRPDAFCTITVSTWVAMGAIACGYFGHRGTSRYSFQGSALLTGAATFLLMPLLETAAIVSWIQWALLSVVVWAVVAKGIWRDRADARVATEGAFGAAALVGLLSGVFVTIGALLGWERVADWSALSGMALVGVTAGMLSPPFVGCLGKRGRALGLSWPVLLTLISGHVSVLLSDTVVPGLTRHELLTVLWSVALGGSLLRSFAAGSRAWRDFGHATVMSLVLVTLGVVQPGNAFDLWSGLFAASCLGVMAIAIAWQQPNGQSHQAGMVVGSRLLCWIMLASGGYLLMRVGGISIHQERIAWTLSMVWVGSWVAIWRTAAADASDQQQRQWLPFAKNALADTEASCVLVIMWVAELLYSVGAVGGGDGAIAWQSPWLWLRLVVTGRSCCRTALRARRESAWCLSALMACWALSVLAVRVSDAYGASWVESATVAVLTGTSVLSLLAFSSRGLALGAGVMASRWVAWLSSWTPARFPADASHCCSVGSSAKGLGIATLSGGAATVSSCVAFLFLANSHPALPLMIGGIALLAVSAAELAGSGLPAERENRRRTAVTLTFLATFLWASVGIMDTPFPLLALTMRWFVAAVCTMAVLTFALPKMLGTVFATAWRSVFRGGETLRD